MSNFEGKLRREMEKNLRSQESDNPYPCPYCETEFRLPGQAVVFGGEVTCPHCKRGFTINSSAADTIVEGLKDFRRKLR